MDDASLLQEAPHRRFNPLTREWVLVSPHRTKRPWLGKVEKRGDADLPAYDPSCYLCPGNERADGARNPKYSSTFAFDNDFAALLPDGPSFEVDEGGLLVARAERGICRVICFSPRHDLTIPRMTPKEIGEVITVWAAEFRRFEEIDWVRHVQIFENRGALMGGEQSASPLSDLGECVGAGGAGEGVGGVPGLSPGEEELLALRLLAVGAAAR